ncbi:DEHA2A08932p [Debaryomyces hansenii CBS767]|uniref:Pre-mRNA-splicing factor RSE1 n=1 Tax=Debaryomyces hansenii (strain ATCC 36239 / CBS 767 / BCRC 21394 / JCM 1990 / NBRC 0083 / IGC 2968) TaxID=284592 RepID=RSE1_DEBHA|nr:DEHA2A08932p [Debaryomyces hansenii CBS767]Q6BYK1.2 RecName: Full=Pre-mRNA-splicing factor RSE1 [Debaryomyces hansenii CBS767]CAG84677.2 DEHA2A08932p [Debaryomyces hansenii CBS767]|eukprot:XP_456718.2 DEHA2A08932p [Debaryomyces hansenii CBS767]
MSVDNESLYLYNLTIKHPSSCIASIVGQFLGNKKSQEIILANSTSIELWKADSNTGKLEKIYQQASFGIIQGIDKIRLVGTQKDYVVITSDSGKLVVLEFDIEKLQFVPLFQEPHSKNGLRRTSPGEYLCVDPHNRAILIGAIEKNKLVYKVQSNDEGKLELSSPLETFSKHTLTLQICAMDTGFENPMFAAIECDYNARQQDNGEEEDAGEASLLLNYYELDQGLNHVVKHKSNEKIPGSSSHLIPLPDFIGGLLVCSKSTIIYAHPSKDKLYLPIPIRSNTNETLIVNHVIHRLKKNNFFILVQSQLGDCFKITIDHDEVNESIENINITYFDTIPLSQSLNIFKSGFLFANVATNNKLFYQFEKLGDDNNNTTLQSCNFSDYNSIFELDISKRSFKVAGLENLALVDIMETLNPITDGALIETLRPEVPDPFKQLTALSSHSYLKTLTHGISTNTVVSSPLPIKPTAIHTTRIFAESANDEYLVISSTLSSQTLVLSIGEVVEEVNDSQFVTNEPTINVQQVGKSSVVQIYSNGIRHIKHTMRNDTIEKKYTDWYPPAGISIIQASTNNEQVIIGLSNREICYFEIDPHDDQLVEYQERLEMSGGSISALAISSSSISKLQRKSSYAIVGCSDETIQAISLKPHNCLEIVTLQALSANSSSIAMVPHGYSTSVHIGMENGLYVRVTIDEITGKLSDTRIQFLGSKPVQLSVIGLPQLQQNGLLAISSRPWIGYYSKGDFKMTPLLNTNISNGASFYSEDIGGEGIVGIDDNNLIILTISNTDGEESGLNVNDDFIINSVKLRYLPRKMNVDSPGDNEISSSSYIYIIESEYGITSPFPVTVLPDNQKESTNENIDTPEIDQDYYDAFGFERSRHSWASCVEVIDFNNQEIVQTIELPKNESAISLCRLQFESQQTKNQEYLIIGTTQDQKFLPNSYSNNYLYTFTINKSSNKNKSQNEILEFVHKTELDYQPTAIIPFNGRLLVGMSNFLRLYDLGQRQLLRKASSNIEYLKNIIRLTHQGGSRIVVGDSSMSTTFVKYDSTENQFIPFADDIMKRQITALVTLDYDTIIGGDKFGNIFVSRVPETISQQSDKDWSLLRYQESYLNGSGSRLKNICEFYLQDIPTSFTKGSLVMGGKESIIYTGIQGTLGLLLPLSTENEVKFLGDLQLLLRKYFDYNFDDFDKDKNGYNLLGKDHLKFRSYYNPVKNVMDGDLIERFYELSQSMKIRIGTELNRTPREIEKKISEMRHRSAF